jgi:hypothetical protein
MKRKTIEVEKVKKWSNNFLMNSPDEMTGERFGITTLIESVLMDTDNYKGFGYLIPYVKGIDESRRVYY